MLSDSLALVLENQAERLTERWVRSVNQCPLTPSYQKFDDKLLLETIRRLYGKLTHWLNQDDRDDEETARFFVRIGQSQRKAGIPVSELSYAMILARKNLVNFISEEGIVHDTLEAHRWMELSRRICQLFDHAHYFVMRGYEEYYPKSEKESEGWVNRVMNIFNVGGNPFGQTAETMDTPVKR